MRWWRGIKLVGELLKKMESKMGSKMECPKCGHAIGKEEKFCEECGIPIQDLTDSYRQELEKKEGGEEKE